MNRQELLAFVGVFVQIFIHGFYTAIFISSACFTVLLKPTHGRYVLAVNVVVYMLATTTSLIDVVMTCMAYYQLDADTTTKTSEIGWWAPTQPEQDQLVESRICLFIVISTISSALVIWRLSQLWVRARYAAAGAWFLDFCAAACGIFLVKWRGIAGEQSASLTYRYMAWRYTSFGLHVIVGLVVAGRTYWVSRHIQKLFGSHLRTRRSHTVFGAFVDSGVLFSLALLIDLANSAHLLRSVLPQFAGLTATLIIFQGALGKSALDVTATTRHVEEEDDGGRQTPILDTIFSTTPGMSLVTTTTTTHGGAGGGRAGMQNRAVDSLSIFSSQFSQSRSGTSLNTSAAGRGGEVTMSSGCFGAGTGSSQHLRVEGAGKMQRSRSVGSESIYVGSGKKDLQIFIEDCSDTEL